MESSHCYRPGSSCSWRRSFRLDWSSLAPATSLYRPGQDCGNQSIETRIATQRIKVRIDIDVGAIETVVIANHFFQPVERLILLAKRKVNHRKSVCWHVAGFGLFIEPGEYLPRFISLSYARLGVSELREH